MKQPMGVIRMSHKLPLLDLTFFDSANRGLQITLELCWFAFDELVTCKDLSYFYVQFGN
jgi:hypothetical protein